MNAYSDRPQPLETMGQAAYRRVRETTDPDMPPWEALKPEIRATWERAALLDGSPLLRKEDTKP